MKKYKDKQKEEEAKEPSAPYGKRSLRIFHSFEEQESYELQQMAALSPEQVLQQMRLFINTAYGMYSLPRRHTIKIISAD